MIDAVIPSALRPGLYGLTLPVALPIESVNVYLLESDPLTLIDAGTNNDETFEALSAGLATLGYQIADLRRLIITHHHADHSGGAGRIAKAVRDAGADLSVLAHPRGVFTLEEPIESRMRGRRYADQVFGVEGGATAQEREIMARSDDYLLTLFSPVKVTGTLEEGDSIHMGGADWQVLFNPGHAGDQITFFQPESRVWIAADHLIGNSKSNPLLEPPDQPDDPRPQRLIEYERELRRIHSLDPVVAYAGHGEPITQVRGLIEERFNRRKTRTESLFELIRQADPAARTLANLAHRLFPHTSVYDNYLTFSETLGHLDFLVEAGRVTPVPRIDGTIEWQPDIL